METESAIVKKRELAAQYFSWMTIYIRCYPKYAASYPKYAANANEKKKEKKLSHLAMCSAVRLTP